MVNHQLLFGNLWPHHFHFTWIQGFYFFFLSQILQSQLSGGGFVQFRLDRLELRRGEIAAIEQVDFSIFFVQQYFCTVHLNALVLLSKTQMGLLLIIGVLGYQHKFLCRCVNAQFAFEMFQVKVGAFSTRGIPQLG